MVAQIHREYLRMGHESWILSMETSDDRGTPNVVSFGKKYPRWREPFLLRPQLKQLEKQMGGIDVLHTHLTQSQLFAKYAMRGLEKRPFLVTTEHDTSNRRRNWGWGGRAIDRLIFRNYDRIICISEGVRHSLLEWLPSLQGETLVTIHNGVDIDPLLELSRKRHHDAQVNFLSVGRVIPKKNFGLAIKALSTLNKSDWSYTIVGEGEEKQKLERLARQLGVEDRIHFAGYVKEVGPYYQKADCFLLPSLWEGFGLVAVEAMAAGLPVVAADVPGLAEVVGRNGEGGRLISGWEMDLWKNELKSILEDRDWLQSAGDQARQHAKQFDIKRTAGEYLSLYQSAL